MEGAMELQLPDIYFWHQIMRTAAPVRSILTKGQGLLSPEHQQSWWYQLNHIDTWLSSVANISWLGVHVHKFILTLSWNDMNSVYLFEYWEVAKDGFCFFLFQQWLHWCKVYLIITKYKDSKISIHCTRFFVIYISQLSTKTHPRFWICSSDGAFGTLPIFVFL